MACPDLEKLEQLLSDDLPQDDRSEIETHLRACTACSERLSDLSENEKLLQEIEHVLPDGADQRPESAAIPASIGHYTIVRELGRGGMGVVYEAKQESPRRSVALKVIRGGGRLDGQRAASLRREAQALARLKHPGIAAIHEAGQTDDGDPYFAMELVEGTPLADFTRREELSRNDRLTLFCRIAGAVAYAHQRGVIHRDIKPSNILVDADGRPKLLDFGLARITDSDVTMTTVVTEVGKIQGTLPYMSPEQARGNPDDIDLRSDVYSLGVVLFELLTGQLPYSVDRIPLPEAVRVICEAEPRRPSTINRTLRGDLETIALKALQKDPDRRYQSVAALSDDVRNYLTHQPILARPPSATYQFRKLVERHKAPFAFAGVVFALVSGFAGWMTVMYGRAEQLRLAEKQQRLTADGNLTRALAAETASDGNAESAERVSQFMVGLFQASFPGQANGRQATARELLDSGAARVVAQMSDDAQTQYRLLLAIAHSYANLGLYSSASNLLRDAMKHGSFVSALAPAEEAQLLCMRGLFAANEADSEAGHRYLDRAFVIVRAHDLNRDPVAVRLDRARAIAYQHGGDLPEAATAFEQALDRLDVVSPSKEHLKRDLLTQLGSVYVQRNQYAAAEAIFEELRLSERQFLPDDQTGTEGTLYYLGQIAMNQNRHEEAEELLSEALDLGIRRCGGEHPDVARLLDSRGINLIALGKFATAEESLREALAIRVRILGDEHHDVASSLLHLSDLAFRLGRKEEGIELGRRALDMGREIFGSRHLEVALTLRIVGIHLMTFGQCDQAAPLLEEAVSIFRELVPEGNHIAECMGGLAACVDDDRALELLREAVQITRKVYDDDSTHVANALKALGLRTWRSKGAAAAELPVRQALEIERRVLPKIHDNKASTLAILGSVLTELDRNGEAAILLRESYDIRRHLLPEGDWRTANTASVLGGCLAQQERFAEAEPLLMDSYPVLASTLAAGDWRTELALKRVIHLYEAWGKPNETEKWRAALKKDFHPDAEREEVASVERK